jgi:glycerate 2-kinase
MASRSPSTPLIILAPDSFKESLTAQQVCVAMQAGLEQVFPDARYVQVPMADGGEGTVQSLVDATGGTVRRAWVTGPLGDAVEAGYGILGDGETAVIEMAAASGLELVPSADRDVRRATTYGTGELISVCLDQGVRRLVLGLGGSATNDGGAGMAQALGAHLLDASGRPLPLGGAALANLARIDVSGLDPRLRDCAIEVASDVTNPLCGPTGASAVYGPQKGATPTDVTELDAALEHYADIVRRDLGRSVGEVPGAGAAGGLGAGLLAFTQARISSGIDIVIRLTGLVDHVAEADLVLTGEGRMDGQTRFGKTPFGVASVARAAGTPVIGIAGSVGEGVEELAEYFDAIIPVIGRVAPLSEVLAEAASNVERTCANVGRLIALTIADR